MIMITRVAMLSGIFLLGSVWMASGCAEKKVTESATEDHRTETPLTLFTENDMPPVKTEAQPAPSEVAVIPKPKSTGVPTPPALIKGTVSNRESVETARRTPDEGNTAPEIATQTGVDGSGSPVTRPSAKPQPEQHAAADAEEVAPNESEQKGIESEKPKPLVIGRRPSSQGSPRNPPKEESKAPVQGVVPQAPEEIELKSVRDSIHKIKDEKLRQFLTKVAGTWKQTVAGNQSDLFEGGYRSSLIHIGAEGIIEIERAFDKAGSVVLRRKFDYLPNDDGGLVLGGKVRPSDGVLIKKTIELPDEDGSVTHIVPAARSLPATVQVQLSGDSLVLDGKTYRRVK